MRAFVRRFINVEQAGLITDEYKAYLGMSKVLPHAVIKHQKWYVDGFIHTNTIEGFWALLKRGMFGQFHSVSRRHLQKYVDEFCYRYNLRDAAPWEAFDTTIDRGAADMTKEKKPLKVIAGAPDRPLIIGDIEIPCYVLEDKTRVLTQRGIAVGLGMSPQGGGQRLTTFIASTTIKPFHS